LWHEIIARAQSRFSYHFPVSDAPVQSDARPALLPALLTGIGVFLALLLFAAYILNRKPKFAPELVFKDAAGVERPLKAELSKGKPILLHFWATWCAPCREELPVLTQSVREAGDGFIFIPVAIDEQGKDPVVKYLSENKISLDSLYDPGGEQAARIGSTMYPETWLLSPDGRVVARWQGAGPWSGGYLAGQVRSAR